MSDGLKHLRKQIDDLDDRILEMLNARAGLAQDIGHLKKGPIYRPEREAQVIRRLQKANQGPLSNEAVAALFKEIMSSCRALEQQLTIAYLGPQGTFSEAAAVKHFGRAAQGLPVASIDEVFRAVERGEAHYGVVPVENSSEGAVGRSLDLLLGTSLKACGEVMLRVHQNLLRQSAALDGIVRIYSHAQSLAQCQGWLDQHLRGVERISVGSNAEAARLAGEEARAAAIASDVAASHYGLHIVARNIEDDANNTTRFLVLALDEAAPSGRDKTSLAVWAKNRPGALLELIEPFARCGVGLTKLESRPARSGSWEYVFFIDLEGHHQDEKVAEALRAAEGHASRLKILGSYPAAL
jgi:chorismate mutase/prephenate dehydratase